MIEEVKVNLASSVVGKSSIAPFFQKFKPNYFLSCPNNILLSSNPASIASYASCINNLFSFKTSNLKMIFTALYPNQCRCRQNIFLKPEIIYVFITTVGWELFAGLLYKPQKRSLLPAYVLYFLPSMSLFIIGPFRLGPSKKDFLHHFRCHI